ncbi:hypothetical protein PYCC9005_002812 [Savitreella phatthalungensis]
MHGLTFLLSLIASLLAGHAFAWVVDNPGNGTGIFCLGGVWSPSNVSSEDWQPKADLSKLPFPFPSNTNLEIPTDVPYGQNGREAAFVYRDRNIVLPVVQQVNTNHIWVNWNDAWGISYQGGTRHWQRCPF